MSNYGPKEMKLYSQNDNLKRKSSRTGESIEAGPNSEVRAWNKSGQQSLKSQASREANKYKQMSKKNPVKIFTKEEIEELYGNAA